jgi:hypothetical protein
MADERERVAEELRRVRDEVRRRALLGGDAGVERPAPRATVLTSAPASPPVPETAPPPSPPDAAPVNAAWRAEAGSRRGLAGFFARVVEKLLAPRLEAQVAFNSRQVQLDNELLAYLQARVEATHRHYDAVLGGVGRHLAEIDERHLILQEELVAHVQDLVKRVDLALAEGERQRRVLELALQSLETRVSRLEETRKRG